MTDKRAVALSVRRGIVDADDDERRGMPRLIRLYIRQVAVGFALAAVFVALLLWFNVANLWHLVSVTPGGGLAVVMLWVFNGIVFAGVQFGIAIMGLGRSGDGEGD